MVWYVQNEYGMKNQRTFPAVLKTTQKRPSKNFLTLIWPFNLK